MIKIGSYILTYIDNDIADGLDLVGVPGDHNEYPNRDVHVSTCAVIYYNYQVPHFCFCIARDR